MCMEEGYGTLLHPFVTTEEVNSSKEPDEEGDINESFNPFQLSPDYMWKVNHVRSSLYFRFGYSICGLPSLFTSPSF